MKHFIFIIIGFFLFLIPCTAQGIGNTSSIGLSYYELHHSNLRKDILDITISYLKKKNIPSSKKMLVMTLTRRNKGTLISIDLLDKDDVRYDNKIFGYTKILDYTFILRGDEKNWIIKRLCKHKIRFTFCKRAPMADGVISWLFFQSGRSVELLSFNENW